MSADPIVKVIHIRNVQNSNVLKTVIVYQKKRALIINVKIPVAYLVRVEEMLNVYLEITLDIVHVHPVILVILFLGVCLYSIVQMIADVRLVPNVLIIYAWVSTSNINEVK